ncbi:MAG: hypothetical protein ACNA8G_09055 [Gammaproteobacteria bacterium]
MTLHLLQVDAEGADDEVLYACNISELRPALINFESKHLVGQRMAKLQAFLSGLGYTLYQWNKTDTVALRFSHMAGGRAAGPGQGSAMTWTNRRRCPGSCRSASTNAARAASSNCSGAQITA